MIVEASPHPDFEPALIGQIIEWAVWSHLVAASDGDLRVFLPTRDMGIDGVVLRHSSGQLAPNHLGVLAPFAVALDQLATRLEE